MEAMGLQVVSCQLHQYYKHLICNNFPLSRTVFRSVETMANFFSGNPNENANATVDPYKTLFVARIVSTYFFVIFSNLGSEFYSCCR